MTAWQRLLAVYDFISSFVSFGTLIGTTGFIFAIWAWFRPKSGKLPIYGCRSFNLINENQPHLKKFKVEFEGRELQTLTISKFVFLNKGHSAIRRDDFPESDPLKISSVGAFEILDAEVLSSTNDAIACTLHRHGPNSIGILFDHLNAGDGFLLRVSHTGNGSKDIDIVGTFIDTKKIRKRSFVSIRGISELKRRTGGIVTHRAARGLVGVLIFCFTFPWGYNALNKPGDLDLLSLMTSILGVVLYWYMVATIVRSDLPSSLEDFFED